ncbi:MAG: glycoside hydrolase family 3 N-terminal domain-containing protein [Bdellovibrionales bacterium]
MVLHDKSEDTQVPQPTVHEILNIFRQVSGKTDFAMSTHLLNFNIDPDNMVTFSKKWIEVLRKDIGFDGILMTDALFMFDRYPASVRQMEARWPQDEIPLKETSSIFAARAILAGHDMAFLEGTATKTYKVFNDLLYVACQDKPTGKELNRRILESYDRITRYKEKNKEVLTEALKLQRDGELSCTPQGVAEFENLKKKIEALNITPLHGATAGRTEERSRATR